jgi:ATP-dependent DNA helicase RecG
MDGAISLETKLGQLYGVGSVLAEKFERLGVKTVSDLIELLPFRSEDRTNLRDIKDLEFGTDAVIAGSITRVHSRLSKRGSMIIQAALKDSSGSINAVWFNQRYLLKQLAAGQSILLFGQRRLVPSMGNPFFVKKIIPRLEVAPVYPATAGLSQYSIAKLLRQVRPVISQVKDLVPPSAATRLGLPSRRLALEAAHFSPEPATLEAARRLLGFEELLLLCLKALEGKKERQAEKTTPLQIGSKCLATITAQLPWPLSPSQKVVVSEIFRDLERQYPMNRLLYGEVGSGKTAVGMVAVALVAQSGQKALWLAPTTALAHQLARFAQDFGAKLALKTALVTGASKQATGDADIVVGTHALLGEKMRLSNVGLIVIDEQHRFGVEQRGQLLQDCPKAHLLMMSATPIPRTLTHTLFGHLDISYLEGKLSHQQPVKTYVFTDNQRAKAEQHIDERIKLGQPGYVICPLIEPGNNDQTLFGLERKSVTEELSRLKLRFPQASIALLHGRMKSDEKEEALRRFREGETDVLLATSVVEVGIDNPEASWILIEEADRFGLSQLHQLRGRVGRGKTPSVCFLHNSLAGTNSKERLNVLVTARNGLEIAEADLRLRGPGNIAGADQSGLTGLRYADLSNLGDIKKAYALAESIFDEGINQYPKLRAAIKRQKRYGFTKGLQTV